MTDLHVHINMNKNCAECGKPGAAQNGLCLKCTGDAMFGKKPMKSWQGRAVANRLRDRGGP